MSFTCPYCKRESYHPQDEKYGYCGFCHRFTGDADLTFTLTPEEMQKADAIATEAIDACLAISKMFPATIRGMMAFTLTVAILQKEYPALFKNVEAATSLIGQWIYAGEPESPGDVMKRIVDRSMREEQDGGAETTAGE